MKDASGHTYDLGGMEIIVRDWWTGRYDQDQEKTAYDLAKEEYVEWLQETYNFKITRTAISQWADAPQDFIDYASAPADDKNYVFVLREDPLTTQAVRDGLCFDLSKLSCLDFSAQKFQRNRLHETYTFGDAVYVMWEESPELKTGVYFNKRLLQEAGINPNNIYDMQANGTWTWEAFEQLCKKAARDTNNDGEIDLYALGGTYTKLVQQAVYSNGGHFISKDANGRFVNSLKEETTAEGLQFARTLTNQYWAKEPEGADWDYYKDAFKRGEYAFCIEDVWFMQGVLQEPTYGEGGNVVTPAMTDPVGFVMFPKGPKATDYVNCWNGDPYTHPACIPSNYDADRAWKIAFAWNLYTDEVPGYENNDEWKAEYEPYFDQRSIDETISMMRTKGTVDCNSVIPEIDLGIDLTYNIWCSQPTFDGLLRECNRKWDYLVKRENGEQFPEVKKDANGRTIDLGGMEIVVADWWSEEEKPTGSIAELAKKEYLDWIQETYNFKISSRHIYEWGEANETAVNYVNSGGDDKNYVFTVHDTTYVLNAMKDGKFYDLSTLDCLDFSKEKFQQDPAHERWRYGNGIYGMRSERDTGRQGVLFNKRLLYAAGIDPNSIYDMQADGTWTWDKFEELCKKATRDVNHDGVIDVYGCEGYQFLIAESAVYSNGGVFVGKDKNGNFTYNVEDEATLEALEFTKRLVDSDFWRPDPEGAQWDDYYNAFCNGEIVFIPGEFFSEYRSYWNNYDKWDVGFVLFPKGPRGENYANYIVENTVVIPSCYDSDRAWKIAFAWDLFTDDTYAYDESEEWIKEYKDIADERTYYETLAIPIEKGNASSHKLVDYIDLGYNFIWEIKKGGPSIAELIDANQVRMKNAIREANGEAPIVEDTALSITSKTLTLYDCIAIEFRVPAPTASSEYHDYFMVVYMNGIGAEVYPEQKDDMLIFTVKVGPHMLGDEVVAEPHAIDAQGQEVIGQRMRYSVKTYCMNILTKDSFSGSEYADLRKLCVDILKYGDAAQTYAGYKMDTLASDDLTDAQRQQGTNHSTPPTYNTVKNKTYATVSDSARLAEISSVALYLEGTVNIQYKVTAADLSGLRLVVTDGMNELGECVPKPTYKDSKGRYCVNFDGLNAGQMKKTVYATVMKGNKKVSNTYRYSIESYANSMGNSSVANLGKLLTSMMDYGDSAAEYAQNHR